MGLAEAVQRWPIRTASVPLWLDLPRQFISRLAALSMHLQRAGIITIDSTMRFSDQHPTR